MRRDRNHPSVVIWSIGNEEPEQGTPRGARIATSMKRLVRELDPTRPITEAMNGDWGQGLSQVVDVQGFNYAGGGEQHLAERIDEFHRKYPKQPTIGTETGSTVSTRGIYQNDKAKGYVSAYDVNFPPWAFTAEHWWSVYDERQFLSGGFAWTGFDYRGEPTPYGWPCITRISAFWIPVVSRRIISSTTRRGGDRSPCCICFHTGTGAGRKARKSTCGATRTSTAWNFF